MQDALTTFFSQFEPVPWLCYLFPVLALGILIRCAVSLLTFRREPEVWAWLTTPDGTHIPVTHWENTIGRGKGCDIVVDLPTISRSHAVLTRYDDGSWTISDAQSKSGVFVNGRQTALAALRFGDVITMGGVNFTLVPITKEQERIQAGTRTRAGRAVRQAPTLLLLTLFQLLAALQLILGGCDAALELTAFGGLIGLEWALYLGLRIFRRTGFEVETLAFFLCTMGLAVVSSSAPESLVKELMNVKVLDDASEQGFETILSLYKGDLLLGYDTESWIVPRSMYYHEMFLRAAYKYLTLLSDKKRYEDVMRVSRRALEIDKFDSRLNLELMNSMVQLGMKSEAMNHYNYTVNLHYTQLGTRPSEDILDFYKTLIKIEHSSETALEAVSRDLEKDDGDKTAFVCDYSIFKDIYKINMRNLQRLGITVFLGVLTLSSTNPEPTDADLLLLDKVMGMLQATLKFNLRKGDTISRYSPSQFVVLLPTHNHNTGSLALERVKSAFYKNCSIPDFILTYKLTPIGYNNGAYDGSQYRK